MHNQLEYYQSPCGKEMRLLTRSMAASPVYSGWTRVGDTKRDKSTKDKHHE